MSELNLSLPSIPWDLVDEARRRSRLACERRDLELREPSLSISWDRPDEPIDGKSSMAGLVPGDQKRMIEDPHYDLHWQFVWNRRQLEHLLAGEDVGMPLANHLGLHLLHYGTGPLSTAFGSQFVVRNQEQPFFEPTIHTPQQVMKLRKPDLRRDGILPAILERIEFYNEATEGRLPITFCDTASPWTIATQIWHYEDMLEAVLTAPEAVHYLLDLVTECIIEWHDIQKARIGRWTASNSCIPEMWVPTGGLIGDDTMVAVSPAVFEEFYLPCNNRVSRAFGGLYYHCCLKHDHQFASMAKTDGFLGWDGDLNRNDVEKLMSMLGGRGVCIRKLWPGQMDYVRRFKGRVGCFLHVGAPTRDEAVRSAQHFLAEIRNDGPA